jgi:hypothetical protein
MSFLTNESKISVFCVGLSELPAVSFKSVLRAGSPERRKDERDNDAEYNLLEPEKCSGIDINSM